MACAILGFQALGSAARDRWLVRRWRRQGYFLRLTPEGGPLHLLLLLLCRERRRDIALPLAIEELGILFVDPLLLFRRRIRTRDMEGPGLHEIEISVAAARLAPSGKLCVAFDQRRRLRFPGRRLFGGIGAFLKIDRRARAPPPRIGARRCQHEARGDRGHQQCGYARHYPQSLILKANFDDTIYPDCRHYRPACHPVTGDFSRAGYGTSCMS